MKGIVILLCEIQTSGNRTTTPGPTEATDVVLRRLNVEAGARPRVGDRSRPTTPSAGPTYPGLLYYFYFSTFLLFTFTFTGPPICRGSLLLCFFTFQCFYFSTSLLSYFSAFLLFCVSTFLLFYFSFT